MDISLHSFILVIGVVVIGFIVWDGVKKVRAARANQLNQTLEGYDSLDSLSGEQNLPVFDDLEIKDDFLKEGLAQKIDQSILFDAVTETDVPAQSESMNDHQEQTSEIKALESDNQTTDPLFDVLEVEKTPAIKDIPIISETDDGFEHFGARRDELSQGEGDQVVAKRTQTQLTSKASVSAQDKRASTVLAKQKASVKNTTEKNVSQRVSKEALAAQLVKAQEEAKAQSPKPVVKVEEEITLDDKEPVPVLMEPVELGQKVDPNPPKQHELVLPEFIQQTLQDEPIFAVKEEPVLARVKSDLLMEYIDDVQALPVGEKLSEREAAQEIFVINILKQDGKGLAGRDLHHVFNVCDMRHGEMGIFHRFEKADAQGKIQFSVVNAIEPGTFNLKTIDDLITPGISLFMSLPGPDKPMEAFDAMAEVALVFARNFNATLHDDTQSDLTPQTLEHYRNRVREFSRKHLSHKK
jgi:cell division protein ZipA